MKRKIALILAAVFVIALGFAYMASLSANVHDVHAHTYQFLTDNGFAPIQACGIMATIKINSDFDPIAASPNDLGYGLCQWTGVRLERMDKFAKEIGKPIDSAETQLLFMMEELNMYWINNENSWWTSFEEAKTPKEAAQIFYYEYTRPGYVVNIDLVGALAEEMYEQFAS